MLNFCAASTLCAFSIFLVKFEWLSGHLLGKWLPIRLTLCFLIVNLGFSHLGVWSGNYFLLAPFPDRCLLLLLIITIPCSSCTPITVNHCHCSRRILFREGRGRREFQWELNNFLKKGSISPISDRIVMS